MVNCVPLGGTRMTDGLRGYFTKSCTILRATEAPDAYGDPVETFAALAGHVAIAAAMDVGDVGVKMKKQEVRTNQTVVEMQYRRIILSGAYPTISVKDRARVDGVDWPIVSVSVDQTSTITVLMVETIEPGAI